MFDNIKAIIFDLDGTLADSVPAIKDAVNEVRAYLGEPLLDEKGVLEGLNKGVQFLVDTTLVGKNHKNDDDYRARMLNLYVEAYSKTYTNTKKTYDGFDKVFEYLKSKNIKIAILSNKSDDFVAVLAGQLAKKGTFSATVGPTDTVTTKPNPALTRRALEKLGVGASECVMVGDSEIDILTAKNAGLRFIGAGWGYRGRKFLEEHGANAVADTPLDLISMI